MLKKWVCILFLTCLAVPAAGCAGGGQNYPTPTPLPQVVSAEKITFTVERGPIISQRDVAGEIVPAQQEELFFRSSGYINRVLVKNGDRVKKGDILAELRLDDLLDQLQALGGMLIVGLDAAPEVAERKVKFISESGVRATHICIITARTPRREVLVAARGANGRHCRPSSSRTRAFNRGLNSCCASRSRTAVSQSCSATACSLASCHS